MKKTKLLLVFASVFAAGAALSACDGNQTSASSAPGINTDVTYEIKVWAANEALELTQTQCNAFYDSMKVDYPDLKINFTVEAQGEGDAASAMITDVQAGADIFCFAQDQLGRLKSAGALQKLSSTVATTVKNDNVAGAVTAVTLGDDLYAYPLTADNGYFMYYDKSVISEDSIDDMTKIISDCQAAGKQFSFQLCTDGGWYNAGFFFATGCESTWEMDSAGVFTGYTDTYNSANGLIAAKGMQELISNSAVFNSASSTSGFSSGSAVVISGTWDYNNAVNILGENLGVADLPSFTVDGNSYHIGSFAGYKLMGVKPQSDTSKNALCQLLAQYLTQKERQLERFDTLSWGPSNKEALDTERVKANPGLIALAEQSAYAVPQGNFPGDWWNIAAAIGSSIQSGTSTLESILSTYEASIAALISA